MKGLKLGQYVKGNSIIHNLDPRTKLIYCLFIVSSTLINSNWKIILLNLCTLILVMFLSKISILKFFRRIKSLLILFILSFIFQSILTQGEPIFHIGKIIFTKQGAYLGILTVSRLLAIYLCSTVMTMTTSPMKLTSGLESLFSPLSKLHIPVNQLSVIVGISLRFIPTIIEETENVKCAQKSRGAQFESGNLFVKLKSIAAVIIPVLATSLQRANDLAAAMESRCFDSQSDFQNTSGLSYKREDIIVIAAISLNLMICFLI
jgi:energy-coupling factor transport system permease protein